MKKMTKWEPLPDLKNKGQQMTDALKRLKHIVQGGQEETEAWSPASEIYETATELVIEVDLPGVVEKDIDLQVDGNLLLLRGERHPVATVEGLQAHRCERSYGAFSRTFMLRKGLETSALRAKVEAGVLSIYLPITDS